MIWPAAGRPDRRRRAAAGPRCRYDPRVMTDRGTRTVGRLPRLPIGRPVQAVASAAWRDVEPDALAPVVLVAPGFLTMPAWYDDLAASLRRRGAADVVVAPVYAPDWILAAARGLGPITTRVGRALLDACSRSAECPASRGAPVLYVGHSAGGLIGRLLTSPAPFEGRTLNAAGRIGALVTLGTPNATTPIERGGGRWGRRSGEAALRRRAPRPGRHVRPDHRLRQRGIGAPRRPPRDRGDARERFLGPRPPHEDVHPHWLVRSGAFRGRPEVARPSPAC